MAPRPDSDVDPDSEEEERRHRKKEKNRSRSRSRDRKKSKKHKKEKKRRRRHSSGSGADTAEEGGETPVRREASDTPPPPSSAKLPGIGKYDSEGSDAESDKRKEYKRDDDKEREKERDREKRGERRSRKKRSRTRSRSRGRRSRSRERRDRRETKDKEKDDKEKKRGEYRREEGDEVPDLTEGGSKDVISLSIEETNKLREKLGLKPLNLTTNNSKAEEKEDDPSLPGVLIPGDHDKTRHLVPEHWGEKANNAKIREKLGVRKEKRTIESKLAAVKGLADSDSDDDAEKWVQRQKSKVEAKNEAEKRAKMMSELDDEFGVGDIVQEKLKEDQKSKYTSRNLKGLRVEHSTEHFESGETILTLKDSNILDEKYEDVLVNVNILDTEHTKKNFENIKSRAGYQAYDSENVDEVTGEVKKKDLLYQYNEEIDGEKKESFTLEGGGTFNEEQNKARELAKIRQKLKLGAVQTLETPELRVASDYYNDEEMAAFKKPKQKGKKKKIRKKMLKADDLLQMQNPEALLPAGFGNQTKKKRAARIIDDDEEANESQTLVAGQDYDNLPVVGDLSGVRIDDDDVGAISSRLNKAKKLKNKKGLSSLDELANNVMSSAQDVEMEESGGGKYVDDIILDQTQEFCRGLGENMTFEPSGLSESVPEELLDFEQSLGGQKEKRRRDDKPRQGRMGGWEEVGDKDDNEMDVDDDSEEASTRPKKNASSRPTILDEEALAMTGMGAALKMANQMGYLEKAEVDVSSTFLKEHVAKRFQVEDKTRDYAEDDRKRRGRDRGYERGGPTSTFQEKKGYKPSVNIEYKDDAGRALTSKEAFRYLSHKFHGKGSGKIKTEKRHRKNAEDKLMEKMSSLDTPLNTLTKQQDKAKELGTAYLVLSGNKQLSSIKK